LQFAVSKPTVPFVYLFYLLISNPFHRPSW